MTAGATRTGAGRTGLASRAAAVVLVAALLTGGCATDREQYCEAVEGHQRELTDITSQGGPTALLDALDIYRDLREQAPSDIEDEWQQVVESIEGLEQALEDAGVDPASYDPQDPPGGVTEEQRRAIATAADRVGSRETQEALQGVEQQARDVCKTPLTL
jgi:hypothetical protein